MEKQALIVQLFIHLQCLRCLMTL